MGKFTAKNWKGQKFGQLEFLYPDPDGARQGHHILWWCQCDCGEKKLVLPCNVTMGKTKSCGHIRVETATAAALPGTKGRKYTPEVSSAISIWRNQYQEIEFSKFFEMSKLPCAYCNRIPYKNFNIARNRSHYNGSANQLENGDFIYNGIDRVDSSKSYIEGNMVPCCYECNRAKSNMDVNDFLNLIKMIYNNRCK